MRVLLISKAMVVGAYQRKAEELAKLPGVQLTLVVPPYWDEETRRVHLERAYTAGYELLVQPLAFSGRFHVHFYPRLGQAFSGSRPEVVHADEEPYNLATLQMLLLARQAGARSLFFTWQNLYRRYPFPFRAVEAYNLAHFDLAVAGNAEAVAVLRRKGFRKEVAVIPQFGVDPELFRPPEAAVEPRPFTVGYLGRLVEQKGLADLVRAVAALGGETRLVLVGAGPLEAELRALAAQVGLGERLVVRAPVPSITVPEALWQLDALVLPSRTRPNWKEQFGRILVEAMACGVPVVGSDSGEIPNVIGDAGLVFPEGDVTALYRCLERLRGSAEERSRLAGLGRRRALAQFTHAQVAARYAEVYRQVARCT
ncbi:MAG: glycosyltransferase family 4 protein [Chloroflexi bacterium]|nr:glycosyltransferase family 4 protein [Chloroflexota bacterium]